MSTGQLNPIKLHPNYGLRKYFANLSFPFTVLDHVRGPRSYPLPGVGVRISFPSPNSHTYTNGLNPSSLSESKHLLCLLNTTGSCPSSGPLFCGLEERGDGPRVSSNLFVPVIYSSPFAFCRGWGCGDNLEGKVVLVNYWLGTNHPTVQKVKELSQKTSRLQRKTKTKKPVPESDIGFDLVSSPC